MNIQTIGVIGAGTMGNGIAQACAVSGLDVVMIDIDAGLKRGCNPPIGPLALADMIGLDVGLAVMKV